MDRCSGEGGAAEGSATGLAPDAFGAERKIGLFLCGVQKGGTTSLHACLAQHPELSASTPKELHVFDDETVDWSSPPREAFDAHFEAEDEGRIRFESTPIYAYWPPSIARLQAYNPQAKLILIFRDPFERAVSHWRMQCGKGIEALDFATAIRDGRSRVEAAPALAPPRRLFSYVERGFYGQQVRRLLTHFPREQMLFLRSDDLLGAQAETLERIASFVGIGPFPPIEPMRLHPRPDIDYPSAPTPADLALIAELLRDDLTAFAELTGLDISDWPTARSRGPEEGTDFT